MYNVVRLFPLHEDGRVKAYCLGVNSFRTLDGALVFCDELRLNDATASYAIVHGSVVEVNNPELGG